MRVSGFRVRSFARILLPFALLAGLLAACAATSERAPEPSTVVSATGAPTTTAAPTTTVAPMALPATTVPAATVAATPEAATVALTLLVTNSAARHVSFVDPERGVLARVEVGAAPWGLALAPGGRAYVATAEGVAVVDTVARRRLALIPYRADVGTPRFGEYRPGGMGIAAAPDGHQVYVGVYLPDGSGQLEIVDAEQGAVVDAIPIGARPFQVLADRDGHQVYAIDHDTFTITIVDPAARTARTLPVAPLGRSGFDKPHYAALRADGHLLLPFQGRTLLDLDPASGAASSRELAANTHQHGVALTPDQRRLLIVGTGPAGEVSGAPQLSIVDLASGEEQQILLARAHESVAVSPDGRWAYLTGGYTFADGGWDGLTIVDLQGFVTRELAIPDRPLDIAILPDM
jgi:DNA-binding beta-propeller fold protein YncE